MLNHERKELIRRAKELLSRPDVRQDKMVSGRKYLNVRNVFIVWLDGPSDTYPCEIKIYVGSARIADVAPYNSHWENPHLEEHALSVLRQHMVLDDLAGV